MPYRLVTLDSLSALPAPSAFAPGMPMRLAPPPTDLVGPADVLDIAIYEAGVALFSSEGGGNPIAAGGAEAAARSTRLPPVRVDDEGRISLPFVGQVRAMGHTTAELQAIIRKALQPMSQDPQVMVSVQQSITNSVILSGEIARPGRLVLATNRETLAETIALAGGQKGDAKDIVARLSRKDRTWEIRLNDLLADDRQDIPVYPGDRITLVNQPLTFAVMGAPNKVDHFRFPRSSMSLAEAVALAGGANPDLGDAAAVFVFRFERREDGSEEPVVFHLDMLRPGAVFISQRFAMTDRDVLYIGNARANQPGKLIQLISQLFAPVVTVERLAR